MNDEGGPRVNGTSYGAGRPEFRRGQGLVGCLILCILMLLGLALLAGLLFILVVGVRLAFTVPL